VKDATKGSDTSDAPPDDPASSSAAEDVAADPTTAMDAFSPDITEKIPMRLPTPWDLQEGEEEIVDPHAPSVDEILGAYERKRAAERAGPQKFSRDSDGGSNVAYAATTEPARGLWLRDPTSKVKIAKEPEAKSTARDAPTVVIARARAKARAGFALASIGLAAGVLAAVGVMLSLRRPIGGETAAPSRMPGTPGSASAAAYPHAPGPVAPSALMAIGRPMASSDAAGERSVASAPGLGSRRIDAASSAQSVFASASRGASSAGLQLPAARAPLRVRNPPAPPSPRPTGSSNAWEEF